MNEDHPAKEELDRIFLLLREKEWITDGYESISYCIWCNGLERKGHFPSCEVFGEDGVFSRKIELLKSLTG